jgi:DNA modification methylase
MDEHKSRETENLQEQSIGAVSNNSEPTSAAQIRDRIKGLRRVRAGDLVPHAENWRVHPRSQMAALRGVLNDVGFAGALVARELPDGALQLIDGHARAEIAADADTMLPVLITNLSEQEAKYVMLTFDPIAQMAEADADRLAALLQSVRSNDDAVNELFEQVAGPRLWVSLHPLQAQEIESSPERADELRKKWGTATSQLWCVGRHRLACGDARDAALLQRLWTEDSQRIRMIWTDPPYGIDYASKNRFLNRSGRGNRIETPIANDALSPEETQALFQRALNEASAFAAPGAVCYATVPSGPLLPFFIAGFEGSGFGFHHLLVWVKQHHVIGMSDYHYRHELIIYGWRGNGTHYFSSDRTQDSVFEIARPMVSDLHPTTKPVELIARMIACSSRPGELVFDPFGGSGSTILAAHQLGRIGYGCEVDPAYLAVQLERLSAQGLEPELINE